MGLADPYHALFVDGGPVTDAFLAFPIMAAALVMLTFFAGGWFGIQIGGVDRIIVLPLVLFGWMQYAHVMRGNVLAEREEEYVDAELLARLDHRDRFQGFQVLVHVSPSSLAIVFFSIGWNLVSDGLCQALNPRQGRLRRS